MLKLNKPLSFFIIFLVFVLLLVFGLTTYLLALGVRVKYDGSQKRYALDVSKNEFVKSLTSKYFKNLVMQDEKTNETTNSAKEAPTLFGKINEGVAKPNATGPGSVSNPNGDDQAYVRFLFIGWGVAEVGANDPWNYVTLPFVAEIIGYNKNANELKLKVTLPETMPYFGQTITVAVKCDPKKSYLDKDGEISNPVRNLPDYFSPNTNLFTGQCADEKCSEVGPFCKVSVK